MQKAQFGMIGLGTMGRNFALNVAENGFTVVGYDLDDGKRELLLEEAGGSKNVAAAATMRELVEALAKPRNVMLLVPAGPIVDSVINDLLPHLDQYDLIIDGGNSHFADTERRELLLASKSIGFLGVGVSGGEEGARHGASIMPGGTESHYLRVANIFEAVAAKVDKTPCVSFMGRGSAGHFVKMVHNGIEYGLMQILAETYDFMHRIMRMNYADMSDVFRDWNKSELNAFLVEVTSDVLRKIDAETGKPLVDVVLDKAAQKGTGKWTSQAAMDLGVPIPTIDSAVSMRQISAERKVRLAMAAKYGTPPIPEDFVVDEETEAVASVRQRDLKAQLARDDFKTIASELHNKSAELTLDPLPKTDGDALPVDGDPNRVTLDELRNALICAFIVTYAQGMSLLQTASVEKKYKIDLGEVAKIWRGGCIIRSALLDEMRAAYTESPDLPSLMLHDAFADRLQRFYEDWREVNDAFARCGVASLCFNSSINYFEAFRSQRLPANLIQAQRDYFGAHTYQRIDKEGIFHTPDWKT